MVASDCWMCKKREAIANGQYEKKKKIKPPKSKSKPTLNATLKKNKEVKAQVMKKMVGYTSKEKSKDKVEVEKPVVATTSKMKRLKST
jgi:hypothetical protein